MTEISAEGTWHLVMDTPIGEQRAVLELSIQDGASASNVTGHRAAPGSPGAGS
ncbi:hypothetical protein [Acrocarpospora pleiomorpha]|uniref:hypothetical protein n=1 Tax=Acrocarpospora pleiomorpha TaxID=90975 RepID=UPI0012D2C5BE|nr:hypothetical protein [Acrocarpospora pleiomorpha]